MTGLGRNRLLSALLISALAFFLITVSSLFSADAGMPTEEKTEGKYTLPIVKHALTVGKDTLAGNWYDNFERNVRDNRTPAKDNEALGGWKVQVSWLKEQIAQYELMYESEKERLEQKIEGADPEKYKYFIFVVTRGREQEQGHSYINETIVDPEKHGLWIRGFRNPQSFAEDFPPIQWP